MNSKERQILDSLEAQAEDHGVEIVSVEAVGSRKSPIVRIYIDTEGGVSFQELTDAQEWIGEIMDDLDPFPGAYTMEVSSPGIDRPLRTSDHFRRFVGEEAKIALKSPLDGRSKFTGVIAEADDDAVKLEFDGGSIDVPYEAIKKANLIGKVEF